MARVKLKISTLLIQSTYGTWQNDQSLNHPIGWQKMTRFMFVSAEVWSFVGGRENSGWVFVTHDVKPSLFPSHLSKVELRKLRASVNVGDPGCRGVKLIYCNIMQCLGIEPWDSGSGYAVQPHQSTDQCRGILSSNLWGVVERCERSKWLDVMFSICDRRWWVKLLFGNSCCS